MKDLKDKVGIVTGAASGIGKGMAEAFAQQGMRLMLSDIEPSGLETVAKSLGELGAKVAVKVTDVANAEEVEALAVATYDTFGAAHVLCNNAGVVENNLPAWELSLDDWEWVLGVNVMGVVHGIKSFMPRMLDANESAHVVNTASVGGLVAGLALPAYSVSKHAVVALSECIYNDLARRDSKLGISVLCPGWINTEIADSDRNRREKPAVTADIERSRNAFKKSIHQGLEPRAVGDIVVAGIQSEQFYLYTHPHWNGAIEDRFTAILDGEKPASTYLPRT